MSVFRPAAKVHSPDGREWEIYAYKIKLGPTPDGGVRARRVLKAVLKLTDMAAAALRALRSDEWTIDAVTYLPHTTVYTWTTTSEHRGQVLAQVEGSLARGDVPIHLRNAVYRGEDRRSAR